MKIGTFVHNKEIIDQVFHLVLTQFKKENSMIN